jgi:hypothetical protein
MNLRAALASNRDEAITEECEKGEDAAMERCREVLNHMVPVISETFSKCNLST